MWKQLSLGIFFLTLLFIGMDLIFHPHITEFCLYDITNKCAASPAWDLPAFPLEEQKNLKALLQQKFTYLGKGMQSYAFISEDHQYVLKFFKQRQMLSRSWIDLIPLSFNPRHAKHLARQEMQRLTFSSCITAYRELKQETGLLYAHINRSCDLNTKVTLIDEKGKMHLVDLDATCFCIQKYATLIYPCLSDLMQQGKFVEAKQKISAVFALIASLGKKGVTDNDPLIYRNFGLLENSAIQIDVGKLRIDTERKNTLIYKNDILAMTQHFKNWLETHYPTLLEHFGKCLQEAISSTDPQH